MDKKRPRVEVCTGKLGYCHAVTINTDIIICEGVPITYFKGEIRAAANDIIIPSIHESIAWRILKFDGIISVKFIDAYSVTINSGKLFPITFDIKSYVINTIISAISHYYDEMQCDVSEI